MKVQSIEQCFNMMHSDLCEDIMLLIGLLFRFIINFNIKVILNSTELSRSNKITTVSCLFITLRLGKLVEIKTCLRWLMQFFGISFVEE
jgi:hypothetical protein